MSFKTDGNFETTLECNHVVTTKYYPPGTEIFCRRHQKMTRTLNSLKKFTWTCQNCLKSRSYIASRLKAEHYAMQHHRQDRTHHVILINGDGKTLWDSHPNANIQSPLF